MESLPPPPSVAHGHLSAHQPARPLCRQGSITPCLSSQMAKRHGCSLIVRVLYTYNSQTANQPNSRIVRSPLRLYTSTSTRGPHASMQDRRKGLKKKRKKQRWKGREAEEKEKSNEGDAEEELHHARPGREGGFARANSRTN